MTRVFAWRNDARSSGTTGPVRGMSTIHMDTRPPESRRAFGTCSPAVVSRQTSVSGQHLPTALNGKPAVQSDDWLNQRSSKKAAEQIPKPCPGRIDPAGARTITGIDAPLIALAGSVTGLYFGSRRQRHWRNLRDMAAVA
jgi:hypothetical protein